jgi:hypothetical protein
MGGFAEYEVDVSECATRTKNQIEENQRKNQAEEA